MPNLANIPYCGAPPAPDTLMARWNLDPRLLLGLLVVAGAYAWLASRRARERRALPPWRLRLFAAGWALTALALVSPLCALSVSLFCARVGQHIALTLLAAPLVALGLPAARRRPALLEVSAAAAFAVALWAWHSPAPYDATFRSDLTYWAMHLTTWGSAVAFWWAVLRTQPERMGVAVAATVATGLQMALLGAVITFAASPLYAPHLLTTAAWGLTPLEDQELGGALMWVPGGVVVMAAVVAPLAVLLRGPRAGPGAGRGVSARTLQRRAGAAW